jgi:hypothetical protein
MASAQTYGYHPAALPGWKEPLQPLAGRIETLGADRSQQKSKTSFFTPDGGGCPG